MTPLELNQSDEPFISSPARGELPAQSRRFRLYVLLLLLDAICVLAAFSVAGLLRPNGHLFGSGPHLGELILPVYLAVALNSDAYGYQALARWKVGLLKALGSFAFAVCAVLFVAFYAKSSLDFSRVVYGAGSALTVGTLIVGRFGFSRLVKWTLGDQLRSEIVIADSCKPSVPEHARVIDAARYGLKPDARDPQMLHRLGKVVEGADFVLVCCPSENRAAWSMLLKGTNVQSYLLAPEFDEVGASQIGRYNGQCVMQVSTGPLDIRSRAMKRAVDLALTVPAIIFLSPLMLVVALLIKIESPGPVFFMQQRMGRGNRLFNVLKFRSMRVEACDQNGSLSTAKNDPRITRVGRFIRATSIDELPQLINVLNSDMSLVGPRPHALGSMAGFEYFWDVDHRYWHRHSLKPGITGLAQIRGLRGATLAREDLIRRLQADLEYLNNWSIWRDLVILGATLRVLVHPNAY